MLRLCVAKLLFVLLQNAGQRYYVYLLECRRL